MPWLFGLILLAVAVSYPLDRLHRRRLRRQVEQTGHLDVGADGAQHQASPIAAEAIYRSGMRR